MKKTLSNLFAALCLLAGQIAHGATADAVTPNLLTYLGNREWQYQLPAGTVLLSVVFKAEASRVKTSMKSNFYIAGGAVFIRGPVLRFDDPGCAPVDLGGVEVGTTAGLWPGEGNPFWPGSVCRLYVSKNTTNFDNAVDGLYVSAPASGKFKAPWAQSMTVVYYALGENEVKLFKADASGAISDKPAPALADTGIRYDTQLEVDSVSNMMYLGMVFQRAPGWKACGRVDIFDTVADAPDGLCRFAVAGISGPENPHTAEVLGKIDYAAWDQDNDGLTDMFIGGWARNATLVFAGEDGEVRIMKADLPYKSPTYAGTLKPITIVTMVYNGQLVEVRNSPECDTARQTIRDHGILSTDEKTKCLVSS
ncbi:MAG: hypothetical protein KGZ83_07435 [Sulfuricella sp.]|nr:hypothetical protein [Sulfuricella sp.]